MEDKTPGMRLFSDYWKKLESGKTVISLGTATFREVGIFAYFSQGVVCCSCQVYFRQEKESSCK